MTVKKMLFDNKHWDTIQMKYMLRVDGMEVTIPGGPRDKARYLSVTEAPRNIESL